MREKSIKTRKTRNDKVKHVFLGKDIQPHINISLYKDIKEINDRHSEHMSSYMY